MHPRSSGIEEMLTVFCDQSFRPGILIDRRVVDVSLKIVRKSGGIPFRHVQIVHQIVSAVLLLCAGNKFCFLHRAERTDEQAVERLREKRERHVFVVHVSHGFTRIFCHTDFTDYTDCSPDGEFLFHTKSTENTEIFFEHGLNGFHGFIHLAVNCYFCPAEIKEMTEIFPNTGCSDCTDNSYNTDCTENTEMISITCELYCLFHFTLSPKSRRRVSLSMMMAYLNAKYSLFKLIRESITGRISSLRPER